MITEVNSAVVMMLSTGSWPVCVNSVLQKQGLRLCTPCSTFEEQRCAGVQRLENKSHFFKYKTTSLYNACLSNEDKTNSKNVS